MSEATPSLTERLLRVPRSMPWWVWVIAALALVLRLVPIGYGLPYEFDPDEHLFVNSAWHMIDGGRLDPRWYGHPASTLMDFMAIAYALYGSIGVLIGTFDSVAGAGEAYRADVSHFFIIGRVITAVSGTAVVLVAYAVAREIRVGTFWAGLAAVLLALSWPMIQYSSTIRADMLMVLFLLIVILTMLKALDRPSGRAFGIAGVFLGLAAASKYPGALAAVPILIANATLVVEERITPRRGLLWLAGAAGAALITASIVAPYLFINFRDVLAALKAEAGAVHTGAVGAGLLDNAWRYLSEAMPAAVGVPATIVGIAGVLVMLAFRRPRLVALTFWACLAFISALSLWWLRWALPLIPLLAIAAALLSQMVVAKLEHMTPSGGRPLARIALAAVLVFPVVLPTATTIRAMASNDDVRIRAIEWLHANVPDGTTLLTDNYTTQVSSDRYDLVIAMNGELMRWSDFSYNLRPFGFIGQIGAHWRDKDPQDLIAEIDALGVDYVVLSELWIDLYRNRRADFPNEAAVYDALLEAYPVVRRFDGDDAPLGPPVMILEARGG